MPFNHNYRVPPVDTNDTVAMLKYFGVKVETDETVEGKTSIVSFDSNRLPKLSCPKSNNPLAHIILSFPGPQGFGLQSFAFPIETWLDFVHSKDRDVAVSVFNCSNPFFSFVVNSFIINKTSLLRVYNHNRGIFKLPLYPSLQKIKRNFS